jgi:hypothetical protein
LVTPKSIVQSTYYVSNKFITTHVAKPVSMVMADPMQQPKMATKLSLTSLARLMALSLQVAKPKTLNMF